MYKGKRYNVIIILLIFIISTVVGVSAGMVSIGLESNLETGKGELPTEEQETEIPTDISAPSKDADPLTKVAYALDILNNGKGYRSTTYQSLTVLGVPQEMFFQKLRGGGLNLTEEWFKFSGGGMLASFGKNEYRSVLSDGTNMYEKLIKDKSKFDAENKIVDHAAQGTITNKTVAQYVGEEHRYPLNDFFIDVKSEHLRKITEDQQAKKDKDAKYYIVTADYNVNAIPSRYIATFSANGGDGIKILRVELKFYINKITGMLVAVEKNEEFNASYAGISAPSPAVTYLREDYHAMNVSQELEIKRIAKDSYGITL